MSPTNSPIESHRRQTGACSWLADDGRKYVLYEPALMGATRFWTMAREGLGQDLTSPVACRTLAGHFANVCLVAERLGRPVGFVSAFVRTSAPEILTVWRISVAEGERGHGLGYTLLDHLLSRPACRQVELLEAAISKSNTASRAVFAALSRELGVPFEVASGLTSKLFPGGIPDNEDLVRLGPFPPQRRALLPRAGLDGDDGYEASNDL